DGDPLSPGRLVDREGVGVYLRDLFEGLDDPLAAFDLEDLGHLDHPTVHAFRTGSIEAVPRRDVSIKPLPLTTPSEIDHSVKVTIDQRTVEASPLALDKRETTQVIKGRPASEPTQSSPLDAPDGTSVDEALSVLAWLQSRRDSRSEGSL